MQKETSAMLYLIMISDNQSHKENRKMLEAYEMKNNLAFISANFLSHYFHFVAYLIIMIVHETAKEEDIFIMHEGDSCCSTQLLT